jgi:hypothetical protein
LRASVVLLKNVPALNKLFEFEFDPLPFVKWIFRTINQFMMTTLKYYLVMTPTYEQHSLV